MQSDDVAKRGLVLLGCGLGGKTPIVRAMPNTPAAIGQGITALIGNANVSAAQLDVADQFLKAVGQTVRLDRESQMDAVTAVSGSGPAYVFHLIETLAAAGTARGLPAEMALQLAKALRSNCGSISAMRSARKRPLPRSPRIMIPRRLWANKCWRWSISRRARLESSCLRCWF